jgi:hypothetical protein
MEWDVHPAALVTQKSGSTARKRAVKPVAASAFLRNPLSLVHQHRSRCPDRSSGFDAGKISGTSLHASPAAAEGKQEL